MDDRNIALYKRQFKIVTAATLLTTIAVKSFAAGIIADGSAPKNQQPLVTRTANGIPQVNIQTPSASGVSRNRYKQFDVDQQGAILNNSAQHTQTQLGGWVQRNSLLAGGTAKIILNEINSQNPSLLHGPVEIAGDKAELVIANPAGISCNGCGFINAHRSTLTTGVPLFNNGNLSGFEVTQGHIAVSGAGMDDRDSTYSDIIARTVKVNADIWANNLKITTGLNGVTSKNQLVNSQQQTQKPSLSIDVAALGGMYADTIHLIATESGVGVRHAGEMQARTLVLEADGQLTFEQASVVEADQFAANVANFSNEAGAELTANKLTISATGNLVNQGVLDGQQTLITAASIHNKTTGAIYGDDVVLAATQIHNQSELSDEDILLAPTIAARQTMKIAGEKLTNDEAAVIYSGGDMMLGGQLEDDNTPSGDMTELTNHGGLIEAIGNLTLNVVDLENLNAEVITAWQTDSVERIIEVQPEGWSRKYDVSRFPKIHNHYVEKQPFVNEDGQVIRYFEDYSYYDYYATTESTHLISSKPAKLIAGGDLSINGDVYNQDSQILAGGDLTVVGGSLTNQTTVGEQRIIYQGRRQFRDWEGNDEELDFYPWTAYSPATNVTEFNLATTQIEAQSDSTGEQSLFTSDEIPVLNASWFQQTANPTEHFFVETDPRFANYRDWLSSDYMLDQLAMDPSLTMKRLGDGFIEQRLVSEQIAQLTGQRFLSGFADDEAQFMSLMDAGVSYAQAHQLTPGVALSAEQVAMLTSDIVWLEQQQIQLASGETVTALVPKVYVKARAEDLVPETGLLAGNKVDIQTASALINSGTIAGREVVNLHSDFVQHGGQIQAAHVEVNAGNMRIEGGRIQAKDSLKLSAEQDINIASITSETSKKVGKSDFSRRNIKRVAGLYVSGDGAELSVEAGRDIRIAATDIQHSGQAGKVSLTAGNDLRLATVQTSETNNSIHSAKDFNKHSEHHDVGSRISTNGDISLKAGNQLTLRGANINSQKGEISLKAKHVEIKNATASYRSDIASHTERDGTFSSKSKDQRDVFFEATAVASVLSGHTIAAESESDINITGSHLVADKDLTLQATDNIMLTSAEERYEHEQYVNEEESGLLNSGGIGFTIGSQQLDVSDISKQTRQASSELGSLQGNVSMAAGQRYQQQGSNVMAVEGDIDITAATVDIESATEIHTRENKTEFSQSGLSISITNPVISAVQTADQMVEAARETSDPRMKALAAAAIGFNAKNAYDEVMAGQGSPDASTADNVGGVNLAISIGASKSSSERRETIKEAHSSKLIAGGDITISAVGDGQNSDINIKGSQIQAGDSVHLNAEDELNLVAAENSRKLLSENDSSSGSVGISIGTDGLLFTVGMSKGKGEENGQDRSWTETTVKAGEKVALESGGDTALKGAIVSGKQVTAKVGDNLTIQSLQDSSQYQSEQKNVGGSISVGYGKVGGSFNFSASDIESDYASVIEQSGIQAGDNGFQVVVEGNTNLKGAVIASTEEAVEQRRNSFETGTLTLSDIKNKAEYDAEAAGATIAMGPQAGEPELTSAAIASENGDTESTTLSGISDISGNANVRTGDDPHTIAPIFDADKVLREINAQVTITKELGEHASLIVKDYAIAQRKEFYARQKQVTTDEEKLQIDALITQVNMQERVLNILIGGVSGQLGTATGREALSLAAEELRDITIKNSMKFKGVKDGEFVFNNMTKKSAGLRQDAKGTAGTRADLDLLCGKQNQRCKSDSSGNLILDDGFVQWDAIDKGGDPIALIDYLNSDEAKKMEGPFGGIQGWTGTIFGQEYPDGSFREKVMESFGGAHDFIGGQATGLYNEYGNIKSGMSDTESLIYDVWSGVALIPSTPFAMAELLPPEVWKGISIALEHMQ